MKGVDLIASFELEINKIDDPIYKPATDDSIYWLNQAVVKFVKERFNGNMPHRTSYEQNEKRTRDLVNLLCEKIYDAVEPESHNTYDSYRYDYPDGSEQQYPAMMFALNEDVVISDMNDDHLLDTCVFECTADNFMYRINNSLTDFHYKFHRARPLRIRTQSGICLLTDKNYKIHTYTLGYIKVPEEITNEDPNKDYQDFPEYIWPEIVKIAAQMYIENQSDPRYQTLTNEVLTQE